VMAPARQAGKLFRPVSAASTSLGYLARHNA
jgi:hypothetical protein